MPSEVREADGSQAVGGGLGFDPVALREKYRSERDKRLREDGEDQYLLLTGKLARYASTDPYVSEAIVRDPLTDEVEVVVIGGGFSGMLAAARLSEAGVDDVRIIEKGSDFGGTWYWNRYPGAQCDIESYCYLPLLEETGYLPKEKYSYAPEIFEHSKRIGTQYDLYAMACFQTQVTELRWDDAISRWIVSTNRGDEMKARFVIQATGPVSRPKLPNTPGILDFAGHTFHTSRWDYDYTGGDHRGGLHKLADKRVAVIGTGATAIQCVPYLGADAGHLYVFQRTPSSVDFRGNSPTDPEWARSLTPGWQRARRENFNDVVTGKPFEVDLVSDAWTEIFRNLKSLAPADEDPGEAAERAAEMAELADFEKMNRIRARVDETVIDQTTAGALKPWYRQFCKRPTFNDDYLATFNRPNVTLVDTSDTRGVQRITRKGVVTNDVEYEVDCIIYATGFEFGTSLRRQFEFEIIGQDGERLLDHWAKGMRTFHGHSSHGFPNWFFIGIGQNGVTANMTSMFDDQAQHVAYIIKEVRARNAMRVQPTSEAESEWVAEIHRHANANNEFKEACTPGYYNSEGKFDTVVGTLVGEAYTPGVNEFNAILIKWRNEGSLEGLALEA